MAFLVILSLFLSFLIVLPLMHQPLSAGFFVLCLSGCVSVCVGFFGSSWYGFSLFLIYVGGLLVMFGYVTVVMPNLSFSVSKSVFLLVGVFGLALIFFSSSKSWFLSLMEGYVDFGGFLLGESGFLIFLGLGFVLFLALLCVVKVCYFHSGALRPFYFSYV